MIEGLAGLINKLQNLVPTLKRQILQERGTQGPAEIIMESIHEAIQESGINDNTGHLRSSFIVVPGDNDSFQIISTARYASYLNYGSAPSFGRFVPGLGKRLKKDGWHPGNKPYNFMETAESRAMIRISEQGQTWLERALQTIGF